jgi:hypothetical protein
VTLVGDRKPAIIVDASCLLVDVEALGGLHEDGLAV